MLLEGDGRLGRTFLFFTRTHAKIELREAETITIAVTPAAEAGMRTER